MRSALKGRQMFRSALGCPKIIHRRVALKRPIFRPFGAGLSFRRYPGLKPRAESCHPFGMEFDQLHREMSSVLVPYWRRCAIVEDEYENDYEASAGKTLILT